MEDLVCAVHREPAPHKRRAELLKKATAQHDVQAAMELIALDCDFPKDWWNGGPYEPYLSHDAPAVAAALNLPADDVRARAMACAAEFGLKHPDDAPSVKAILDKHHLLSDPEQTIPDHGGLLSVILAPVMETKAIDEMTLRQQIGPKVLELARKGKDARLWNVAMLLAPQGAPQEQIKLERAAWEATGDARFAAGVLFYKLQAGSLAADDADLTAALKQFPENWIG